MQRCQAPVPGLYVIPSTRIQTGWLSVEKRPPSDLQVSAEIASLVNACTNDLLAVVLLFPVHGPTPHTHLLIHTHFWPGSEVLGTSVYRSEAGGQRHGQLLYRPTWASRPVKKDSQLIHWKADLALFSRNHTEIARNLEPTLTGRFWALMVSEFQHFKSEDLGLG